MIKDFYLMRNGKKLTIGNVAFQVVLKGGEYSNLQYCVEYGEEIKIIGTGDFLDQITLTPVEGGFICKRSIKNSTDKELCLKELKVAFEEIDFGGEEIDDYFYCNENNRLYGVYTLPLDYDRLNDALENQKFGIDVDKRWIDPDAINERILNSPYQAFPAIHLGNYSNDVGVVHGTLCQDVFFHNYNVGHKNGYAFFNAYSAFKSIAYRNIKAGESLLDVWYIGLTDSAGDINHVFDGFTKELRKVVVNTRAKNSTNKNGVSWSSWNDGI